MRPFETQTYCVSIILPKPSLHIHMSQQPWDLPKIAPNLLEADSNPNQALCRFLDAYMQSWMLDPHQFPAQSQYTPIHCILTTTGKSFSDLITSYHEAMATCHHGSSWPLVQMCSCHTDNNGHFSVWVARLFRDNVWNSTDSWKKLLVTGEPNLCQTSCIASANSWKPESQLLLPIICRWMARWSCQPGSQAVPMTFVNQHQNDWDECCL